MLAGGFRGPEDVGGTLGLVSREGKVGVAIQDVGKNPAIAQFADDLRPLV